MGEKLIESRLPRSFFGKLVKFCFIFFNVMMLFWLIGGLNGASENMGKLTSEAEQAGAAIGTGIGVMMVMGIWIFGVIIMTPVLFLTRGRKVLEKVP